MICLSPLTSIDRSIRVMFFCSQNVKSILHQPKNNSLSTVSLRRSEQYMKLQSLIQPEIVYTYKHHPRAVNCDLLETSRVIVKRKDYSLVL